MAQTIHISNPRRVPAAQQSIITRNLALDTRVPPIAQLQWPNPQQPRHAQTIQYTRSFLIMVSQVPPIAELDWPNPRVATPASDLGTWVQSGLALWSPVPPARTYSYPNPRGLQRLVDYTWVNNLQENTLFVPVVAPFSFYDWQNPRGLVFPTNVRTWIHQLLPFAIPAHVDPFFQADWPVPKGRPYPQVLRGWASPSYWVVPSPSINPFNQREWSVPAGRQRASDLSYWSQAFKLLFVVPSGFRPRYGTCLKYGDGHIYGYGDSSPDTPQACATACVGGYFVPETGQTVVYTTEEALATLLTYTNLTWEGGGSEVIGVTNGGLYTVRYDTESVMYPVNEIMYVKSPDGTWWLVLANTGTGLLYVTTTDTPGNPRTPWKRSGDGTIWWPQITNAGFFSFTNADLSGFTAEPGC